MKFSITTVACLGSVLLSGYCVSHVAAQSVPAETAPAKKVIAKNANPITEADRELLRKFFQTFSAKTSYITYESEVSIAGNFSGENGVVKSYCRFVGNPNSQFRLQVKRTISSDTENEGEQAITIVSDGKRIWEYNQAEKQYAVHKASSERNFRTMGTAPSLFALFGALVDDNDKNKKPPRADNEPLLEAAHDEKINGVPYRIFTFAGQGIVFQLTLEKASGGLRSITMTGTLDKDSASMKEEFRLFSVVTQADPKTFTFTPPTEATKVAEL